MTVKLMTKSLIAAIAALSVASAVATTSAQAKDGCGKGMVFNGRSCVLKVAQHEAIMHELGRHLVVVIRGRIKTGAYSFQILLTIDDFKRFFALC